MRQNTKRCALTLGVLAFAACAPRQAPEPTITTSERARLSSALAAQGDQANAANILNAPDADRTNVSADLRRTNTLLQLGEIDEAITLARAGMNTHPDNPDYGLEYARVAVRAGRLSLASDVYKQVLSRFPDNVNALVGDGAVRAQDGDLNGAIDRFRQAIARRPGDMAARSNLALALAMSNRYAEAIPILDELDRDPAASPSVRQTTALARANAARQPVAAAPAAPEVSLATAPAALPMVTSAQVSAQNPAPTPIPTSVTTPVLPVAVDEGPRVAVQAPRVIPAPPVEEVRPPLSSAPVRNVEAPPRPTQVPGVPTPLLPVGAAPNETRPVITATAPQGAAPDDVPASGAMPMDAVQSTGGPVAVQLGSLGSRDEAVALWDRLSVRHAVLLAGMEPRYEEADIGGRTYWRLRAGSFEDRREATQFCSRLRQAGAACIAQF